ncbi:MAG: ferrous iron transport protein A [Propionibacteriaceae bacterium]|jgi:Fe2+ transport system protein FeoA|nr:ferrous iron transport protein A [Propionibacteriaceae bacterium]
MFQRRGDQGSCSLTLSTAPFHHPLAVVAAADDPAAAHRLLALGWRPGAGVSVVKATVGGARVIALGGARVAIGGPLAKTLRVALVDAAAAAPSTATAEPATAELAPVGPMAVAPSTTTAELAPVGPMAAGSTAAGSTTVGPMAAGSTTAVWSQPEPSQETPVQAAPPSDWTPETAPEAVATVEAGQLVGLGRA